MQPFRALAGRYAKQNREFKESAREVNQLNGAMLRNSSSILTLVCCGLFALTFIDPYYVHLRTTYGITLAAVLVLFFLSNRAVATGRGVLPCLYALFSVIFLFTIYLSAIAFPEYRATVFLGVVPTVPMLIIDKSHRLTLYLCGVVALHTILSFCFKAGTLPYDDVVNSTALLILGLFVSEGVRNTRLENFRLQRQTMALSQQDFLTGLYNRRKMYDLIQDSEEGRRIITGVILFDIDHFKGYNDLYGHQAGDDCLTVLGRYLLDFGDTHELEVFRFGGEEFLCFFYGQDGAELARQAEALRQGVLGLQIPYPNQEIGWVSVSVGYCKGEAAPQRLISGADQALYQAKSDGRNCCREGSSTPQTFAPAEV